MGTELAGYWGDYGVSFLRSLLSGDSVPTVATFVLKVLATIDPYPLTAGVATVKFVDGSVRRRRQVFVGKLLCAFNEVMDCAILNFVLVPVLHRKTDVFVIRGTMDGCKRVLVTPTLVVVKVFVLSVVGLGLPGVGVNNRGLGGEAGNN